MTRCVEFLAIIPALVFRMCGPFDGDDRRGPVQHLVVIYRGSGCDNSHLEDIVVSNKVSRRHGPDFFTHALVILRGFTMPLRGNSYQVFNSASSF